MLTVGPWCSRPSPVRLVRVLVTSDRNVGSAAHRRRSDATSRSTVLVTSAAVCREPFFRGVHHAVVPILDDSEIHFAFSRPSLGQVHNQIVLGLIAAKNDSAMALS